MNNLLEIMDKESCSKSEVYLYEEEAALVCLPSFLQILKQT